MAEKFALGAGAACTLLLAGCGEPAGLGKERAAADTAGTPYQAPRPKRALPSLEDPLTADALLAHAFLANADLEAAYHRWRQALARVTQAGAWDDPRISFEYLTSSGRMRAWDRTTLEATQTIPTAGKRGLAAQAALSEAVAARRLFEQRKFDLQRDVLAAAADYAFLGASLEINRENVRFLRYLADLEVTRQKVGRGRQQDLLRVQVELESAENDLRQLEARRPQEAARANALVGRGAAESLPFPREEPATPIGAADARILALAAERNPELSAMAAEVGARQDALAYARRAWVPDLTLGIEVIGEIESSLVGMIMLPFQWPRLRAMVREAEGALAEAEARRLAASDDLGARTVIALVEARDAERQVRLYMEAILPKAEQALAAAIAGYGAGATGAGNFLEVIDSQRMLLTLRLAAARARALREKAVADLEAILAMDRAAWQDASLQKHEDEGGSHDDR